MGRTRRRRKNKHTKECNELRNIINLQKSLRLKCPKIQIHYFSDTGWGMKCKKKIEKGEVLLALPLGQLITPAVQCEIFSILNLENESPQFLLSIFLIYECHLKEKSRYFDYIKSLPKSFTNPYFCVDNEIKLLPEFIRQEIISQKTVMESVIDELLNIISNKLCSHCGKALENIFSQEKFIWAWFIVNTRSVYYEDEKFMESLALAPFLDFFNHSNDAVTKMHINVENGLYILETCKTYNKYDQVFIKYGAHSNLALFLEYGFILPENSDDFIEFSFEEVVESVRNFNCNIGEISKLKYNFIRSNKLHQNLTKNKEFSWNFNSLAYVLITKNHDLSLLQAKTYSNSFTAAENNAIKEICKIASEKKIEEFTRSLARMERIKDCSVSFQIAKHLIKIYIDLLE